MRRLPWLGTRLVGMAALLGAACDNAPSPKDPPPAQGAAPVVAMKPAIHSSIPIESVARYPQPGTVVPGRIRFSPDDSLITYLASADDSLTRQLFAFDPATGTKKQIVDPGAAGATEQNLSREEKLRRERMRERGLGVTRYDWAKSEERLLIPMSGDLFVQDGADAPLRKLVDTQGKPAIDAQFNRAANAIAYVQDAELYVADVATGDTKQLTTGARGTGKTHGLAEYIAQEEMGRHRGYWWSHDGAHLAYAEVDETHIPRYRILHQGKDAVGDEAQEDHAYPFAGAANAKVRLGVVPRAGGRTVWMDLGMDDESEVYLARMHWMPNGELWAELENRAQSRLDLVRFDLRTGARTVLLTERSDIWINLHHIFEPLEGHEDFADTFVWASERSGFRHLYLYRSDGTLVRQLTAGDWMVDTIEGVDVSGGQVYFTGTKDAATERHLYRAPLRGGDIERLTREPGMHNVELDHGFSRFVDSYSDISTQPVVTLRSLEDGRELKKIHAEVDPEAERLGLRPPELVTLAAKDGTELHGALYVPEGDGPFPTIISVYGGPHAQRVTNSWALTVDMRAQYLRSLGYVVFKLDNRGSARRGLAFEGAIRHDMGNLEVQDQVDGVQWLVGKGLADPERVGIYGWSYGGYMAAIALGRAPQTFKVAVAGAPVTHWDGYDTHYTERYMGTPQNNAEGYRRSAVMNYVDAMTGKLMLVHGLIDENVHFRHTARLINAMIAAQKDYDLQLFPNERHMPRSEADRVYMETRIREFFAKHL